MVHTEHVLDDSHLDAAREDALYRAMHRCWHPVMYASDLTSGALQVVLLGQRLAVVRLDGQIRVFPDLCVHRGTALSLGTVEELDGREHLRCAYHGWTFGADGRCTSIPARFGRSIPASARVPSLAAVERYGLIWVCLEQEPIFPLPELLEYENSRFRILHVRPYDWECSLARRLENYVDFAHFAWVHDGLLGDRNHPDVPDHDVRRTGSELRFGEDFAGRAATASDEHSEDQSQSHMKDGLPYKSGTTLTDKSYRVFMPGTVWQRQRLPGGKHYVLLTSFSPLDRRNTRTFSTICRDYDLDERSDDKFLRFNDLVVEQDRPVVESQRPEELPVDLSAELHIRGVDRVSIEYRKWLVELANDHGEPPS